ncbi:MAG: ATP synthase subunit I [Tissierellaceae bacterium]|nr:ATP synthase subunit I [Tissierellaceae bacterium]
MNNDIIIKIYKRVIVLSFIIVGFSLVLFSDSNPIILGYVFGALISMIALKLLDNTINKAISMSPNKASAYSMFHYFLRYFIYFVVLSVAAIADYLNLAATILGLLIVKFVIFISTIFDKSFNN